ncbi:hypothetical protein LXL04_015205 [Taraxacum kok-saghyz]
MMMFKVDFEKAYDSLSWDFLDRMMEFMGCGVKWRLWIKGCLVSARASVLVNGSPTAEFEIQRGLRQGDPLSPFLFIIAMEGLHVAMEDAVHSSLFRGISVGINNVAVSHLFYADDAMFMGSWDRENVQSLIRILKLFHLCSGLKINLHKSKLYGVGVEDTAVRELATYTGCSAEHIPFVYLGLPIGERMHRVDAWNGIVEKFRSRLSKWKLKMLSIGGRLTLTKSVLGSLGNYYLAMFRILVAVRKKLESIRARFFWGVEESEKKMQWVKWDLILNSRCKGGLSVGSLRVLNYGLLYKWKWRFINGHEQMWVRLIKSIYGLDGGFGRAITGGYKGGWMDVLKLVGELDAQQIVPPSAIRKVVGDGRLTKFWYEVWLGEELLCFKFHRLYALSLNRECLVSDCWSNNGWRFTWRRNIRGGLAWSMCSTGEYSVASVRAAVDLVLLPNTDIVTRWNRDIPIKVNVLLWRLALNRLPVREVLVGKGIDVESLLCPVCDTCSESVTHLFFQCPVAQHVWRRVLLWLVVSPSFTDYREMVEWVDLQPMVQNRRAIIDVVFGTLIWVLWTYRNAKVFGDTSFRKDQLFDSIVKFAFNWASSRNHKISKNWNLWMQHPLMEEVCKNKATSNGAGTHICNHLEVPSEAKGWLEDVGKIFLKVEDVPNDVGGCFACKKRHMVGRKVLKINEEIDSVMRRHSLIIWTDHPIPLGKVDSKASTSMSSSAYNDFASREHTFKDALKALEANHKSHMIALWGMPGVGKTTMMQRLKKVVLEKKMFSFLVQAVIGQKTETIVIQEAVADYLGIKLNETTISARADKLRKWFENNSHGGKNKFLIILDDVWEFVDLNDIGLSPLPNQGVDFKVLLTSRDKHVCTNMGAESNSIFKVKLLTDKEGKSLFRQLVKSSDVDLDPALDEIADSIVSKCQGLPIAITTIAYNLKGTSKHVWEDSLARLEYHDINLVVNEVFKISYDNLQDEEIKSTFLLCGLFPEDFDIPTEELVSYGWGLQIFNKTYTINEARNRLNTCIERLMHKNLLIESDDC